MNPFRKQSPWDRITKPLRPLRKATGTRAVKSGVTAGATMVAVSVASAAASAVRRRQEGSR